MIDNTAASAAQAPPANIVMRHRPFRIPRAPAPIITASDWHEAEASRIAKLHLRIRTERAVSAVRQSGGCLSIKAACQSVGLPPRAGKIVAQLCDERGIRRRRRSPAPLDPIMIQRAVFEIARGRRRCTVAAACRAAGFEGHEMQRAARIVAVICDERAIPRPRSLRTLLPNWTETSAPSPAFVDSPAQQKAACAKRRKLKQCARSKNPAAKIMEARRLP
jgi:hypothetical protein